MDGKESAHVSAQGRDPRPIDGELVEPAKADIGKARALVERIELLDAFIALLFKLAVIELGDIAVFTL